LYLGEVAMTRSAGELARKAHGICLRRGLAKVPQQRRLVNAT